MNMLNLIKQGLEKQEKNELGDRLTYVGSSDLSCERKGFLSKVQPETPSLETLIKFERGNLAEGILRKAFDASNRVYQYQREIIHPEKSYLKAHIDFVFEGAKELGILECKSVNFMPDSPYDNWLNQLYFQMGLLQMAFPDKAVKGAVIAMDISSGETRMFNNYRHNAAFFASQEDSAERIWKALETRNDVTSEAEENEERLMTTRSPLCSFCMYRADCPGHWLNNDAIDLSPIETHVSDYVNGKIMEKEGKSLAGKAKGIIMNFFSDMPVRYGRSGEIGVKLIQVNKTGFDEQTFKKDHPDLWEEYYRKDSSYSYLRVD
ncbi:Exonuclease domain-containing protein [Desulfonema limicola]|uniref:Exonuclease domain-containing protein n=1 Tax=Desulfonema limicola TaxID=45656 RepID=A0A975B441_9BACT|nr:hypothetical protein [Desulfonema limicola]QTA78440.1 Exonuclease domain-containing protein [Desulfonema limicola]